MAKKTLIVVHGMGQHTKTSVKSEVTTALTKAIKLYPSLGGKSASSLVTIKPVVYGNYFDDYRKSVSKESGSLSEKIKKVDASNSLVTDSISSVNRLGKRFGNDEFFYTHLLDVILYRYTLLSERIRLHVAEEIVTSIAKSGSANVHVLGHSLGTAVVHDTLQKTFGAENILAPDNTELNLNTTEHRLGGIHMIANVSRVLQSFIKVGSSVVRPGKLGCTSAFYEYRHKLDPFTYVKPFEPTNNGGWVDQTTFKRAYRLVHDDLNEVTAANVHSLEHYIANPAVHLPLLDALIAFSPKKAERVAAEKQYLQSTVQGKARAVQEAFGTLSNGSNGSIKTLLQAAQDLKELVAGFEEEF